METYYQIDVELLRSGDVILENSGSKRGIYIKLFDRGNYSHVILVLNKDISIEAVGSGIRFIPTRQICIKNPQSIKILRCKTRLNEAQLLNDARSLLFYRFNLVGSIMSITPLRYFRSNSYFCAELVAYLYEQQSIKIAGRSYQKVTPGRIERDKKNFDDVYGSVKGRNILIKKKTIDKLFVSYINSYFSRDFDINFNLEYRDSLEKEAFEKFRIRKEILVYSNRTKTNLGSFRELVEMVARKDFPSGDRISQEITQYLEERGYFSILELLLMRMWGIPWRKKVTRDIRKYNFYYSMIKDLSGFEKTKERFSKNRPKIIERILLGSESFIAKTVPNIKREISELDAVKNSDYYSYRCFEKRKRDALERDICTFEDFSNIVNYLKEP
ncbi:hypothetical protein APT_01636 [Acetobacter pasteurianus NBRC 101655]|nr:hypothetical protein APT_01636 [Acetobacter pasteurianus NBRC 101655]